jgi:hypothetical protein
MDDLQLKRMTNSTYISNKTNSRHLCCILASNHLIFQSSNSNSSAPLESNVNTRPNNVELQLDDVPPAQMVLYPNPTQKILNVAYTVTAEYSNGEVIVFDLNGRELLRQSICATSGTITLDVQALRNGRYITKLVVDGNVVKQSILAIAR